MRDDSITTYLVVRKLNCSVNENVSITEVARRPLHLDLTKTIKVEILIFHLDIRYFSC